MDQDKALAIIEKHKDTALFCAKPEDVQTQGAFLPVVNVLQPTPADFHDRPINGRMMPKSHYVDVIGEAAGVIFIATQGGTRKEGEDTWVGRAQGQRRMTDGTWRTSTPQEYEFDVQTRAKEDFLKSPDKYPNDIAKEKHIIEYRKSARQRASTGARLRVIRELVGIPIAFGKEDIHKAIVISRVELNTDELLKNPDLRRELIAHTIGNGGKADQVLGPPRDVTPEKQALPAPDDEESGFELQGESVATFDEDIPFEADESPEEDEDTLIKTHRQWFENQKGKVPKKTVEWIQTFLADSRSQDLGTLRKYRAILEQKMQGGAA